MAVHRLCVGAGRHFLILDPIPGGRFILADDRMLEWIAARIPHLGAGYQWEHARGLGVVSKGKVIAGMAVHDWSHGNCQITFAADTPRWATRDTIRALLKYPFGQLGCHRLTTVIARSNKRSIRFNEGIGFQLEGTCRKAFGGEDALIYGLLKEEAPEWMGLQSVSV